MWISSLDLMAVHWMNHFSHSSALFNLSVAYISEAKIVKGLPVMCLFWLLWFKRDHDQLKTRNILIATLLGSFIGILAAQALYHVFPLHLRPFLDHNIAFQPLTGLHRHDSDFLYKMNSFPSDHAALFFAIATGFFLISRRLGYTAFLYVLTFIALPRVYLGLHYPIDILVGGFLGMAAVGLCAHPKVMQEYEASWVAFLHRNPGLFYASLFIICFEVSDMFDDFRHLANALKHFS